MLKLERTSVMNLECHARCPQSDEQLGTDGQLYDENGEYKLGPNDLDAKRLSASRQRPPQVLRQVFVSADGTAPLYWWKEYDTYKVATVANSTSTMYKIATEPFSMDVSAATT